MRKTNAGVTLMELMMVIAVIGILASIAVPSYREYVVRANRSDAKVSLLSAAGALERCYTRFNTYAFSATGCTAAFGTNSPNNHYTITAPTRTDTEFTVLATAVGAQAKDTACGNFTLTNTNTRGVSGSKTVQECWGR
jgi:type IV pilus assembly protein PilE